MPNHIPLYTFLYTCLQLLVSGPFASFISFNAVGPPFEPGGNLNIARLHVVLDQALYLKEAFFIPFGPLCESHFNPEV